MRHSTIIVILALFSTAATSQVLSNNSDSPAIELSLLNRDVSSFDSIWIRITLTNQTSEDQTFLFDRPSFYTGGLWYSFSFELKDSGGNSLLFSKNRALLASTALKTDDELKAYKYTLKPRQSLTKSFRLKELVSINPDVQNLSKGQYFIQLTNSSASSNIVAFAIF